VNWETQGEDFERLRPLRRDPFAAPNYGIPNAFPERADLRTAIHWEPNLQIEKNGKAILSFYTADNPSTYEVRIEGILEDGTPVSERYTFEVRRE